MRTTLALVIVILVALLTGCGSDDAQGPQGPVPVGQTVMVEHPGGKKGVVTVLSADWETTAAKDSQFGFDPNKGAYLVLDIEWSGEGPYNPLYLTFKNEAGNEYESFSGAASGYEPSLHSGRLSGDDDKARGFVVFDAPQGAGKLTVTNRRHQPAGSWTIPG